MKESILKLTILILLAFFLPGRVVADTLLEPRKLYLSGKDHSDVNMWDFFCTEGMNSGEWTTIQVPSNWEMEGFGNYNYGHDHKARGKKYGKESGLYKKQFSIPETWRDQKIQIVFEGVMTDATVKINGIQAGEPHQGSFYRFHYDISELIHYDEKNLLEVKVDKHSALASVNEAERQADYWIFGGIFRPVYLEALPGAHIKRLSTDARADGSLKAEVYLEGASVGAEVEISLFDLQGKRLGETMRILQDTSSTLVRCRKDYSEINPWNPETPTLYILQVTLLEDGRAVHQIREKIGFRTVELRPKNGIYVNGTKVILKGVNRHSFNPYSGRSLSEADHLADVKLIKDMNMNAVRMSHYPPDKRFLEICDSVGLFVLNELGGWQDPYDTIVGPKLIKEMVLRDENHPSVIIWDHGNEGGWNFANEKWFHAYDMQKRPVIYPQVQRNDVDAFHYPSFRVAMTRLVNRDNIFIPTELLHGLYDGGMGAGLFDYWNTFLQNPAFSGGFLWNLRDEAVWRTDLKRFDSDGNHAPDGIVGPQGEKEGSYYTIKELWSPVQVKPRTVNAGFDGILTLENRFHYTNLKDCHFRWSLIKAGGPNSPGNHVVRSGYVIAPEIAPKETGTIQMKLPEGLMGADILRFSTYDPFGKELFTWSWPLKTNKKLVQELLADLSLDKQAVEVSEAPGKLLIAKTESLEFTFSLRDGTLKGVENSGGKLSFGGGPVPVGIENVPAEVSWKTTEDGNLLVHGAYKEFPQHFTWQLGKDGILQLEVSNLTQNVEDLSYFGVSFDYPEEHCKGVQWMGKGPYRVYKNRMQGPQMGVWEKAYNNTITGQSFSSLIYPEFKGYHADIYWARLQTDESDFTVYFESAGTFMKLYTPGEPEAPRDAVVKYPEGDIAFLFEISAIGTKFHEAREMGPHSLPVSYKYRTSDLFPPMRLYFDFHVYESSNKKFEPLSGLPDSLPFAFNQDILPRIPKQTFRIDDYMEKTTKGADISGALEAAIEKAAAAGGGTVVIPEGRWKSGPIRLKSNIHLHISEGATVYFSSLLWDYLPVVYSSHQGIECFKYRPMIYAEGEKNIAISGKGTFHGNGMEWEDHLEYKEVGWQNLVKMVEDGVPMNQRVFDDSTEHFLPPFLLQFVNCENILIEDTHFEYGPFWNLNPLYCKNMVIRNIEVVSRGRKGSMRNGDGIALSSCNNVLIQGCTLNTGDDCIVIKSGRDTDGIRLGIPSEKIVIKDCICLEGHGGVVIGSETSGGIRDVYVESCVFRGTSRGIRFKTARTRGAYVKNIYFRNIDMEDISSEAILINMLRYTPRYPSFPVSTITPRYHNINIENVRARNVTKYGIRLTGLPEMPMKKIRLSNIDISSKLGLQAMDADDVLIEGLVLETEDSNAAEIDNCKNLVIRDSEFISGNGEQPRCDNCKGFQLINSTFTTKK